MKYWTASCAACGIVKIAQKTKPTTCKAQTQTGTRSVRLCGSPLSDVVDVTARVDELRDFTVKRGPLEFILKGEALRVAFAVAKNRWPKVIGIGYIGTDRDTFQHYFQERGNPKPFILGI